MRLRRLGKQGTSAVAASMVLDCMLAKVKHVGEDEGEVLLLRAFWEVGGKQEEPKKVKMPTESPSRRFDS